MAKTDEFILDAIDEDKPLWPWPAFGLPLPEDVPDPIPLEKLLNEEYSQLLKRLVHETIRINNCKDAIELLHKFRLVGNLKATEPQMYAFHRELVALLNLVSLQVQKAIEVRNLFTENLMTGLTAKVRIKDNLESFFRLYESPGDPDLQVRRELIYSLENNKQLLGPNSVQKWLTIYNKNQSLTSRRNKFNEINFLTADSSARAVPPAERTLLARLIEIYDFLLFPPPAPQVVKDPKYAQTDEYKALQTVSFPQNLWNIDITQTDIEDEITPPAPVARPVSPAPQRPLPPPGVPKLQPDIGGIVKQPAPKPKPKVPEELPMQMPRTLGASPDGVNVQKRLYKEDPTLNKSAGLDFENPNPQKPVVAMSKPVVASPVAVPKPIPPAPVMKLKLEEKPQEDKSKNIEDKLEALKKKMGKK